MLGRDVARRSGVNDLSDTLERLVGLPAIVVPDLSERVNDKLRASRFANSLAGDWLKRQEHGGGVPNISVRLELAAATENSEAFNAGRAKALTRADIAARGDLLKVWDATLDKLACPVCKAADGEIVFARERFPFGEPGSVHPRCRCTWHIIGRSEAVRRSPPAAPSRQQQATQPKTGIRAEKAAFLENGMRGVAVPQSGLRPESFEHLRSGGPVYGGPVTFGISHTGERYVIDGRHRLTLARERGETEIEARVIKYGKRMGVRWEYTGKVKI